MRKPDPFLYPARFIDGQPVLEMARRAGYCALIDAYELDVPLPPQIFAIGQRHREIRWRGLHVLTPRHEPPLTLQGHLTFALKYEGANPVVLRALFSAIAPSQVEEIVRCQPTSAYMRRIWFLYEWVTGRRLDLPPLRRGSYVNALEPSLQQVGRPVNSPRHRVRNNLPATPDWQPNGESDSSNLPRTGT
jgi:hypothetical protein